MLTSYSLKLNITSSSDTKFLTSIAQWSQVADYLSAT